MGQLLVRDLEPEVLEALKKRAAKHGRSAEAEHREILKMALLHTPRTSFIDALSQIPNVGEDTDFERKNDDKDRHVFD